MKKYFYFITSFCFLAICAPAQAFKMGAEPALGKPVDGQLGMQLPGSPSMERITDFHNLMLWIIFAIAIFVLLLLIYVVLRYNKRVNPTPSQFSHNVAIEILWTVIPVIILIVIAIPSFQLLYYIDRVEKPDMTLKVTGYQWYWGYEYPDHDDINFVSYMLPETTDPSTENYIRLLSTDNPVVLPVDTNIQILIAGGDVLHSWAVPSLGVKMDAVPGRLNETWVRINKPGIYYGQCSELCGKDHAYMPIEIHAVSKEEFEAWVEKAKLEFSYNADFFKSKEYAYLDGINEE